MPPTITLRPWREDEAPRLYELFNNPALLRNLTAHLPNPYRKEYALEFILRSRNMPLDKGLELAVEYEGEVVGTIGARFNNGCATVGYWLGEPYWGKGIMSAALPLYIAQLPPCITTLLAHTFIFNAASQALLRRCGFCLLPGWHTQRAYDQQVYEGLSFERVR